MAKDSTRKTKPAQKKIYDPQVNELRRQVNLSFERLMCQASGPKELKELGKTGRVILRQKDYDKVIKLYKKGAKQGDAEAQYNLGYMYENGKGVEGDYVIAAEWYEKAAAQGHAKAQNNLAFLYRKGYGVPQDIDKAIELYEKSAGQGCVTAQTNLGYLYKYGTEIGQDYVKAAECFLKAANQGHANAQRYLGYMYYHGKGVEQDYGKAAEWFEKAAEQGDEEAADKLREIYEKTQPARYILMCDYPGLWFRTFIDASKLGFSYTEQHEYYVRSLEDVIARVLEEQVRKAIYALYYPEDDVKPMGHFDYYDVEKIIKSYIPYNENVEATLITIDKENHIIETKTIKVLEFLDNDPDYFREYGVSEAVYQYIATALKQFEHDAGWHYALKKENGYIETVQQWPVPQKDGSWIDADGIVLQPYVWFGVKGNDPEDLWSLYGDMSEDALAFWFSEDPLEYIIENDEEIYSFFRGQAPKQEIDRPDMENILRKCPVSVDEDDDPESIKEKIQAFFLDQYRNR